MLQPGGAKFRQHSKIDRKTSPDGAGKHDKRTEPLHDRSGRFDEMCTDCGEMCSDSMTTGQRTCQAFWEHSRPKPLIPRNFWGVSHYWLAPLWTGSQPCLLCIAHSCRDDHGGKLALLIRLMFRRQIEPSMSLPARYFTKFL